MSIYTKLADARSAFHAMKLSKSGHNKFSDYKYFQLEDFLPDALECLRKQGLTPVCTFSHTFATLTLFDSDGNTIEFTSPASEAQLKGAQPIQNVGATQTYQRRYLYMMLMEIVEHDAVDSEPPIAAAKPETLAAISDYIEAHELTNDQIKFFDQHPVESLSELQAQKILAKLKAKDKAA